MAPELITIFCHCHVSLWQGRSYHTKHAKIFHWISRIVVSSFVILGWVCIRFFHSVDWGQKAVLWCFGRCELPWLCFSSFLCTNIPKLGCSLFWRMHSNTSIKELITNFAIETLDSALISDIENITKLEPELIERWLLTLPARKWECSQNKHGRGSQNWALYHRYCPIIDSQEWAANSQ